MEVIRFVVRLEIELVLRYDFFVDFYDLCCSYTRVPSFHYDQQGFELREPEGWVEISTPLCTPSGSHCFFVGFGDGQWRNVHRYTLSNPTVAPTPMYPSEYTVQSISGFSDDGTDVYFTTTLAHQPHTRHVFKNNECLTCDIVGPENEVCNYASASFSANFSYFAYTCSGPRPSYTRIYRTSDVRFSILFH